MSNKKLFVALLLAPALLLPGCKDWFGTKKEEVAEQPAPVAPGEPDMDDSSEVLVSFNGKPVITADSLEKDFDVLLDENPQLKSVLPFMPDAKLNFLKGMVSQAVVDQYIENKGVDKSAEYQDKLNNKMRTVKRMLNIEYFGQEYPVQVSDADIKKFYEENKDNMPDLMISRGGIKAKGVSFNKEEDAQAFLKKVEAKDADVMQVAKIENLEKNARDFKLVNPQSLGMNPKVRDAIMGMEKFPSAKVVQANDTSFWVVKASEKEEAKYRPYAQVKGGLEQYLKKERQMKRFEEEIDRLKSEYSVVINEGALKQTNVQTAAANIDMNAARLAAQTQAPAPRAKTEQVAKAAPAQQPVQAPALAAKTTRAV